MKISIASDVHLEFGPLDIRNKDQADVLILSGDIMVAARPEVDFLKQCAQEFKHTVYVAGNHEFYHGKWFQTLEDLHDMCEGIPNVSFLEDAAVKVDDVLFLGCTLWTDMNKQDPVTMYEIMNYMNDFRQIKHDMPAMYRRLNSTDVVERHMKSRNFIVDAVDAAAADQKIVVVGHHAPSKASTHPRYKEDVIVNGAYSSDLSELILDRPKIKLWTHGHTHDPFDYLIGSTRIVANPRGYIGYEELAASFTLKTVEV